MGNHACTYHFVHNEAEFKKFKWGGAAEEGTVEILSNQLLFYRKSKMTKLMFGAIGSAIEGKGKEDECVTLSDIREYISIDNKRTFKFNLKDGRILQLSLIGLSISDATTEMLQFINQIPAPAPERYTQPQAASQPVQQSQPTRSIPVTPVQPQQTRSIPVTPVQPQQTRSIPVTPVQPQAKPQKPSYDFHQDCRPLNDVLIDRLGNSTQQIMQTIQLYTGCSTMEALEVVNTAGQYTVSVAVKEEAGFMAEMQKLGCTVRRNVIIPPIKQPEPIKQAEPVKPTTPVKPAEPVKPTTPVYEEVICPHCHEKTVKGAFCIMCGKPFEKKCPNCGTVLPPNARFCYSCGQSV